MSAACAGVGADKVKTLSAPTLVQAADMALRVGPALDWKREFILHLQVSGACTF